ncbi:MAG TPA: hypothetical protein VGQ92_16770 [Actinoplanes sp.]|jgi:hypothetical protein|nr:hypothetical protein [Actinoplanes sp.]
MSLRESVDAALGAGPIGPVDRAAADLALTYAGEIDAGGDLTKLGPALLTALEALHMSPRARAAAKKAVTDDKPVANPLDQLAAARTRKSRAADLDATAP